MTQGAGAHGGRGSGGARANREERDRERAERAEQTRAELIERVEQIHAQRVELIRQARGGQARGGAPAGQAMRRRGEALDDAILDATWELLVERGAAPELTFDAVASRAHTSRSVVYRRWGTRDELVEAAIDHRRASLRPPQVPDTGSLRGDFIALMSEDISEYRDLLAAAAYFREKDSSLATLRESILQGRDAVASPSILLRAQQRGEIDLTGVPSRVVNLPFDLLRGQVLMTGRTLTADESAAILDEVYFPLLRAYGALPGGAKS